MRPLAVERDHEEGRVQLAIAAAVETVPLLAARGGIDRACAGERGEGGLGAHPGRVAAGDEQLRRADGPDAALGEQRGCQRRDQPFELGVDLLRLGGEREHSPAQPPQDGCGALGGAQARSLLGERQPAQALEPAAQFRRSGDHERVQLVERGRLRLAGAAPLEQQDAQLLAGAEAAQPGEALAAEQTAGGGGGVELVGLAAAAVAPRRALALVDAGTELGQVAGKAGAVAARALEREGGLAERAGPPVESAVAGRPSRSSAQALWRSRWVSMPIATVQVIA
jgi:hypothetical protein